MVLEETRNNYTINCQIRVHHCHVCSCQDPDTKSSPLQSNGSAICYPPFILGYNYYYSPYFSIPTPFGSILVRLLISPFYQHHYTWIIRYQL